MTNEMTTYLDQVLHEILDAPALEPLTPDLEKIHLHAIERMVCQCYALLRLELDRKVKLDSQVYSKNRMQLILREFESVIPDIQKATNARVQKSVMEIARKEIRHVLEGALSNLEDAVTQKATRIMVVEDASEYREAVVLALMVEPYFKNVYITTSGEEAMEAFGSVLPELVLLDFRLPGIDGLKTAKRMKEQCPTVKIALVTAYADEIFERAVREGDFDEVIPKANFDLARLQELLEKVNEPRQTSVALWYPRV